MKKCIYLFIVFSLLLNSIWSQKVYTGFQADQLIKGAEIIRIKNNNSIPNYIKFRELRPLEGNLINQIEQTLQLNENVKLYAIKTETDNIGFTHIRLKSSYLGYPIEHSDYKIHYLNNKIHSMNGELYNLDNDATPINITPQEAINIATQHIGAQKYKWEIEKEEQFIKYRTGTLSATYYPRAELVWIAKNADYKNPDFRLCYKLDIYAHQPLSRNYVFVDATTGEIQYISNRIHTIDTPGTGVTALSGNRPIVADYTGTIYRLRESGRGNGIETYDLNEGTNYGAAVDFTDNDNFWNNVNAQFDQYATDAHWGSEMTYDYFMNVHNRNSIDGNGFALLSYLHYDVGYNNAFWNGSEMTYGDGGGTFNGPLTSIDITGHEITHGLTTFTAGLEYQDESGALNESFSDIFGVCIDYWARNTSPANGLWRMGEEVTTSGNGIRRMDNPNTFGDPDTYLGTNWYSGTADNGGVHTNSGVQNFWFYLLVNGGSGTNDLGNTYNVSPMGFAIAEQIAFRNLTVYLSQFSDYSDARFYAIQSAVDLYGNCSNEVIATTNAWYAVGVGGPFVMGVDAQFSANLTTFCTTPAQVNFSNLSSNGSTFVWNFGDGNTSTSVNPSHTYTTPGTYSVQLYADGGTCGEDSIIQTSFITITDDVPVMNDQSICSPASVLLTGNGSGTLYWYANSTGGTPFNTGNTYNTPVINTNTTYYVSNVVSFTPENVGPLNNSFGGGGYHGNTSTQFLVFNALDNVEIVSAWVDAQGSGNRTFDLRDASGVLLDSRTVFIPNGQSRINLNFNVTAGTGYTIGGTQMDLYRNNAGPSYPYTSPGGLVTITGSSAGAGFYYYIYDWEVKKPDCVSSRVPVNITLGAINASFSEAHNGLQVSFTSNAATATNYYWDFGDGNNSTLQNPVHTYAANGTFTVMHIASAVGCSDTTYQTIEVNEMNVGLLENEEIIISVYPNPFKEYVNIQINLPNSGNISAEIQDILGRKLSTIYSGFATSGLFQMTWLASEIPSGVYMVNIHYNGKVVQHKLIHVN